MARIMHTAATQRYRVTPATVMHHMGFKGVFSKKIIVSSNECVIVSKASLVVCACSGVGI